MKREARNPWIPNKRRVRPEGPTDQRAAYLSPRFGARALTIMIQGCVLRASPLATLWPRLRRYEAHLALLIHRRYPAPLALQGYAALRGATQQETFEGKTGLLVRLTETKREGTDLPQDQCPCLYLSSPMEN